MSVFVKRERESGGGRGELRAEGGVKLINMTSVYEPVPQEKCNYFVSLKSIFKNK